MRFRYTIQIVFAPIRYESYDSYHESYDNDSYAKIQILQSNATWFTLVYLLKSRDEVFCVFGKFHKMVATEFYAKIQIS